ncbi:MAG: FAD-dependent oxidoreductase [Oscillatoria sp. SIO1A7]|nr:FAD-dependent oxidoreductase [Oscillatoria sp. SIO1A7]
MKISIVGAGIMGLCTAWAAARQGHQVKVFERGPIPNPLASSCDQHRLIRYPYGNMEGYARAIAEAYAAWDLLWQDLEQSLYVETGTLFISNKENYWSETSAAILSRLGIAIETVAPEEVERRYPFLKNADLNRAFFTPTGGVLLAESILVALAEHLKNRGVELYPHCPAVKVNTEQGRLWLEDGTEVDADVLVVAAGVWVSRLLEDMEGRTTPSRQVVLYLQPPAELASLWENSPMIINPVPEVFFYSVPPVAGRGLKVANHNFNLDGDPDGSREVSEAEIAALREISARQIKDFDRYPSVLAKSCFYNVAPEERFIVERRDRAWILSGFSSQRVQITN